MRSFRLFAVASTVLVCLSASTVSRAQASDSVHTGEAQAALGGRFGNDEYLRLGFGGRLGYVFESQVYLGGLFDYYLGTTKQASLKNATGDVRESAWTLNLELGYDFGVARGFDVRVFGGLGNTKLSTRSDYDPGPLKDNTLVDSKLTVTLGLLGNYDLGPIFVGPEVRLLVANGTALVGGAHVGMAF